MSKVVITQVAIAMSDEDGLESFYLDNKGRVWIQEIVQDLDHTEYDELHRITKSVHKQVWKQLELPEDPDEN